MLNAQWDQIDLPANQWSLPEIQPGRPRQLRLTQTAITVLERLPRWPGCRFILPNPSTMRVYRSIQASWEAVKKKAGLPHIELDDLRHCDLGPDEILALLD